MKFEFLNPSGETELIDTKHMQGLKPKYYTEGEEVTFIFDVIFQNYKDLQKAEIRDVTNDIRYKASKFSIFDLVYRDEFERFMYFCMKM